MYEDCRGNFTVMLDEISNVLLTLRKLLRTGFLLIVNPYTVKGGLAGHLRINRL